MTTCKNTSTSPFKRFNQRRPLSRTEIYIKPEDGPAFLAFVPEDNFACYQVVGESTRRPLDPTFMWCYAEEYSPQPATGCCRGSSQLPVLEDKIPENPKDTLGSKKLPFSSLPWAVVAEAAAGMGEGAIKYGKHNYEAVGVRYSIYFDATLRHLIAAFLGEDIDPDSGIPHITKAISSLLVLRDAQIYNKCTDDRPMAPPEDHLQEVKELFSSLIKNVQDCGKHYDRASMERRGE